MAIPDKQMREYLKGFGVKDWRDGENDVKESKSENTLTDEEKEEQEWLKKYGSAYMGGKRRKRRTKRKKRKT